VSVSYKLNIITDFERGSGFGGSNAHAILEGYCKPLDDRSLESEHVPVAPFVFSAMSEISLTTLLQRYAQYLKDNTKINAADLSWTLESRRSQLPIRTAFSALTIEQLTSKINEALAQSSQNSATSIGTRSKATAPRIMGVFTGQGAQWATMGAELIRSSDYVRARLGELDTALATLPSSDRPAWNLQDEILAEKEKSRIAEAELSQPLCTAIQIVLVDLLRSAGITFQAVVGHSSGEIAAAYASGFLSPQDAIRIAYYRGIYSKRLAGNPESGQKGAMLAVGTSWEDAQELVNLRTFKGRLQIAAHNSPASVTLSGDADAIVHAKKVFDEEKKFARLLQVDTAYHSHHMLPCGNPYVQSLKDSGIKVNQERTSTCAWFSSVLGGQEMGHVHTEQLQSLYWRENMTNAVLFEEAVRSAIASDEQLNLIIEVGPHPALRGPAMQTISDVRSSAPAYTGVLSRGKNDLEAFYDALGLVWTHFGTNGVDFASFSNAFLPAAPRPKLVAGLPSYPWHHGRTYWHESRRSRKIRARKEPFHEILGVPCPDSTARDRRWQNVLKVSEIPWLEGHQLQGQTVFPAAGYCAMAFEAAKTVAAGRALELFELDDLAIPKAITFEEDINFAVETLVTLTSITEIDNIITARFSCYSVPSAGAELEMELMASGNIKTILGAPSPAALASTPLEDYNMSPIDSDKFYANLLDLGYGYTGAFRSMTAQKRRLNEACALVSTYAHTDADASVYLIHPTTLDVTFQATMLAFSAPGDDRLWSLHVPTRIGRIRVSSELCGALPTSTSSQLPICVVLHYNHDPNSICASVDVFDPDGNTTLIQVEDLIMKPFAPATAADDRHLFSLTKWNHATPDGASIVGDLRPSLQEIELATLCERLSYAYLRDWKSDLTDDEWASSPPYFHYLQEFMNHTLSTVSRGEHPFVKREWSDDTLDEVKALINRLGHADAIDIKLLAAVSANIPAAVRGQTTILEHMVEENMLDLFYKRGLGFERYNNFLANMVQQITHRYPHARILEIGKNKLES
jgi:hybrid polyketide synthase / nonribosomal peptide synthetase ACE1